MAERHKHAIASVVASAEGQRLGSVILRASGRALAFVSLLVLFGCVGTYSGVLQLTAMDPFGSPVAGADVVAVYDDNARGCDCCGLGTLSGTTGRRGQVRFNFECPVGNDAFGNSNTTISMPGFKTGLVVDWGEMEIMEVAVVLEPKRLCKQLGSGSCDNRTLERCVQEAGLLVWTEEDDCAGIGRRCVATSENEATCGLEPCDLIGARRCIRTSDNSGMFRYVQTCTPDGWYGDWTEGSPDRCRIEQTCVVPSFRDAECRFDSCSVIGTQRCIFEFRIQDCTAEGWIEDWPNSRCTWPQKCVEAADGSAGCE